MGEIARNCALNLGSNTNSNLNSVTTTPRNMDVYPVLGVVHFYNGTPTTQTGINSLSQTIRPGTNLTDITLGAGFGSSRVTQGQQFTPFQISLDQTDTIPSITLANGGTLTIPVKPDRITTQNVSRRAYSGVWPLGRNVTQNGFRPVHHHDVDVDGDGKPDIVITQTRPAQFK